MLIQLFAVLALGGFGDGLPVRSPASVGMAPERLEIIDRVVREGIRAGGFPGAAVIVGRRGAAVWKRGFGRQAWASGSPTVATDRTIYDLASLTKVVATTTAAMILYDEGRLPLDGKVANYLPGFEGRWKDEVTVRQLLTHRSGLPAGRVLWRIASTPDEARRAVMETALKHRPGQYFEYSDLGADLLGMVVETIAGVSLDLFLQQRVYRPLGMYSTGFLPPDSVHERVAPTEVSPPRGYPLQGQVHDENAYALGGVAGHAGLFGTADDLAIFAQMMLNGGIYNGLRIVGDSTVKLFTQRAAGSRALGWEIAEGRHGAGDYLSPEAYGHVGFTGTSIWIDPQRDMFVILLTNRVHAARARRPATVIADVRNDLSDAAALAVTDEDLRITVMPVAFRADRALNWNKPVRSKRSRRSKSATTRRPAATPTKSVTKAPSKVKAASARSAPKAKSAPKAASTSKAKRAPKAKTAPKAKGTSKAKSAPQAKTPPKAAISSKAASTAAGKKTTAKKHQG